MGVDHSLETPMVASEPPPKEGASWSAEGAEGGSRWPDILGVLWVIVAAFVTLIPTLVHGRYIGSFDFLSHYGLTTRPGGFVHNAATGDISDEVVPWAQAAWTQVHGGHLPLWVRGEALGMPLAFNFGSGAFSLPAAVSYLAPMGAVLWVQVLVSLIVGGTGAYLFARLMGLHPVACAFAGTTWVLSGPFFGYLGLPSTSVMSWAGWQFAAVVLIVRGRHRIRYIALFAVTIALSIYAGNPQIELLILIPLAVFAIALLVCRRIAPDDERPIRRPVTDLVLAGVAGGALAAPLVLPGLQLANASVRTLSNYGSADQPSQVLGTIFQSFWGQPFPGSFVNGQGFFEEQWVYVGAIAVVLSVVAVALRWRRPEVLGLTAGALVALAATILQPVEDILSKIPFVGHTWWSRSVIPLAFCLAMLSGVGLDAVLRGSERRRAAEWALGAFGVIAVVLGLVWLLGRGDLPAYAAHARAKSFIWPAVATVIGLAVFATLVVIYRRSGEHRWGDRGLRLLTLGAAAALLLSQTILLIVADEVVPSSSSAAYPASPGIKALQQTVGSSLVGLGNVDKDLGGANVGFNPDTNLPYGINEFAEYDPITPSSFFIQWHVNNGTSAGVQAVYVFQPGIDSATTARRYGISYVLEPRGAAGPTGGVFVKHVGNEDLYRIPGAAAATLVPATNSTGWPSTDAPGTAVPVQWPGPSQVRVVTKASSPQVLRLRVANFPGWHATIDGRPLALTPFLTMMLQARIPPGKHVIELRYWPNRFTEGLVIAALTVVVFAAAAVVARRRHVRARPSVQDVNGTDP